MGWIQWRNEVLVAAVRMLFLSRRALEAWPDTDEEPNGKAELDAMMRHLERFFANDMSAERLSFAMNSLIPETYKSKAEAFARCLQHKLLSLGRVDPSPEPHNCDPRRLNTDSQLECEGGPTRPTPDADDAHRKTDDSEEELCSHSESENGNFETGRRIQKLTSMSSEESTVDSWSSCQENLTDVEKLDSETEEVNSLAAQVKGSPKLRSFNMRAKRKELREKTWKRNSRRNHSSSTESVDSEGVRQGLSRPADDFDREFSSQCILLDGLEPEDDDVPHRILRESSSTSSLDRHFFCQESPRRLQIPAKVNRTPSEDHPFVADTELLTPPPSPDLERKPRQVLHPQNSTSTDDLTSRIHFAQIETDSGEVHFVEVECLKAPAIADLSRPVHKVAGLIIECASEDPKPTSELAESPSESFVITHVQVLEDTPRRDEQSPPGAGKGEHSQDQGDIDQAEDDDILNSRSRMRRCSSLKTWKTPPGTPGSKKIVRFADALGLDLADVRTFLDDIPKVPSSAYEDLHFDFPKSDPIPPPPPPISTLVPLFRQPGTQMDFLDKVHSQKICLETTVVALDGVPTVTGYVRVQNVAFHKSVHVRYTLNNWETFSDLQATYVPNSCDGFSDRFSFALYGHTLKVGEKLEFALRLECCGAQYWDNNGGTNYVFHCLPRTSSSGFCSPLCSSEAGPWFDFY